MSYSNNNMADARIYELEQAYTYVNREQFQIGLYISRRQFQIGLYT